MITAPPVSSAVDIALLLEGTFPYVSGGVSSWINQILKAFPEYRFGLVFLGGRPEDYGEVKYKLPDNVVHFEKHYMHDFGAKPPVSPRAGSSGAFNDVAHMHEELRALGTGTHAERLMGIFGALLSPHSGITESDFLYSRESWDYVTAQYRARCTDPSFTDYFWTVRIMHQPVWTLYRIAQRLPTARAYHTVSTGYAGLLGAMLKQATRNPLIVSEHGLYTKERKIDLFQMDWIQDNRDVFQKNVTEIAYFRDLWIRFFGSLGRVCYASADVITGLYDEIRAQQVLSGAPQERTQVIPNGVDVQRFLPVRARRPAEPRPVLGLIGRVVPIKDIKTFIRAMRTVVTHLPEAEGWIVGPEDEDKDYAAECHELVESLGLKAHVKFLGFRSVEDVLPDVGLLVLSSISEALPLVILEGYAAGVPVVATDVGSCRQLVYGTPGEDQALGASGAVVRISDPEALAEAAYDILTEPARYAACVQAAVQRVERYYTQQRMFASFRNIYESVLSNAGTRAEIRPAAGGNA